jgi:thioredoxin-like negative regulator of GroEL
MKEHFSLTEQQNILAEKQGVMLYFYNDRCAPCISLRPKVIKLIESQFPKIELVFVNSEENTLVSAHYNVFSNPTIILFIEGREYFRHSKYISEHQLAGQIGRLYKLALE